jgi:putative PIG3 family NAD(P)H quinone oxidoreductase
VPAANEVLIAVDAAGVNRPDLMQRQGRYPPPPGVTDIPGLEVAGTIVAGDGVGRRVMALVAGGGYADLVVAPTQQCLPIPPGVSLIEAAAMPETFFTVWTNVFERGHLAAGEWLLVHGGTSGIGTTAIQLATARGAKVLATAGSDEKCRACERLGALRGINYRAEDFTDVVRDVTGGRGVDVVLDMVGGSYTAKNLACLAMEGRLVQIAVMGGATAEVPLLTIMQRRLTITGSTLRPRSSQEKGAIAAALVRDVWPLVASGRVRPVIDRVFPLEEAADAHRRLESGQVIGKIVLSVTHQN